MKTIKTIIEITRPINCLITFTTIVAACFICSDSPGINVVALAAFAGALVNAGGNVINDYFDIENDKLNRPERPLPSERLSKKSALKIYLYSTLFAFALAYNINTFAVIIVVITSVMMFLYSYKLKGLPLIGNIVVAFFTALAFVFGSIAVGNVFCGIIPALFAFLISLMRELVKDIEDIKGDEAIGHSTFPIKYGVNKSVGLITTVGIILMLSTTLPFLLRIYNLYYFLFVMLFVNGILSNVIRTLRVDSSKPALQKTSKLLKLGMFLGVIAIFIGTKL